MKDDFRTETDVEFSTADTARFRDLDGHESWTGAYALLGCDPAGHRGETA